MSEWSFPGNEGGQVKGVADAGIENFNGQELVSLAREICQNSLDAANDESNPNVIVEFERYFITENQIPGIDEYRGILNKCKDFWSSSESEKTLVFTENAVVQAKKQKSFVLRISDYNTTGLADPYSDTEDFCFDGWNALTKIDGGANKGDDKAGAFGIGKCAPFSNSYYRLVFYRTLNQKNEKAAQGISRLMSYRDETGIMTNGIGYYGDSNGNKPVNSISELDELNKRESVGTDVFIYGFNGGDDWESEIKVAVLDDFLMSFYRGQLQVKIQGRPINSETVGAYIEGEYKIQPTKMKSTYGNYLALTQTNGVHQYSFNFHNMGTLELRILIDRDKKLDRKILIVRKAGMKLFRLGGFSRRVPFTGILELKGKSLNSYFRKMETVAHDRWVPRRHPDPKQAESYYNEIKQWIQDIIVELTESTNVDEMDVEGLGGVLQEVSGTVNPGESNNSLEKLDDLLGEIEIIDRSVSQPAKGFLFGQGDDGSHVGGFVPGTLGKDGEPGIRILKGKHPRRRLKLHKGVPDKNGVDLVIERKPGGYTRCPLKSVRIIKLGTGRYSINFNLPQALSSGRIELVTIGENGKPNRIRITSVTPVVGCASAIINGGFIEATDLTDAERIKLNISIADTHDYAMEVNVYEHN